MALKSINAIRKREFIEAFYQTAKEEGLENASFAKIAKALDVQPSLIVHYFGNKEELLAALIEYCVERYFQIFEQEFLRPGSPEERIKMIIHRLFTKDWNELFDDGVFYSCYSLTFRNPDIKQKFKSLHEKLRDRLEKIIADYLAFMSIPTERAHLYSNQIFTLIDGSYYFINMLDSSEEQSVHLNYAEQLALTILGISEPTYPSPSTPSSR